MSTNVFYFNVKSIITIDGWFSFNTHKVHFLWHRHTFHHNYKSAVNWCLWGKQSIFISRITRTTKKNSV